MSDVLRAFARGLISQLHPRMLWLAIWPFLLALLAWGGLAWWFREDLLLALGDFIGELSLVSWVEGALGMIGIGGFKVFLVPVAFLGLLIPAVVLTALLIIALFAMPMVVDHVATRSYPDLARDARAASFGVWWISLFNGLWVSGVFVAGWIATMPFWLIAPLALMLPLFWWAWLTSRILRVDSLLEHASPQERALLIERHGRSYFLLGLMVSLMNFIPPLFFFAPVYSSLVFTHFSLQALRRLRHQDQPAPAAPGTAVRDMGPVDIVDNTAEPDPSPHPCGVRLEAFWPDHRR